MDSVDLTVVAAADDRNITLMARPHRFMCPPDRDDPQRYTNVTVVGHASRSTDAKRRFYTAVVDNLEALGIPRNCSLIHLHEPPPGDIAIRGGSPMTDFPAMIDATDH